MASHVFMFCGWLDSFNCLLPCVMFQRSLVASSNAEVENLQPVGQMQPNGFFYLAQAMSLIDPFLHLLLVFLPGGNTFWTYNPTSYFLGWRVVGC